MMLRHGPLRLLWSRGVDAFAIGALRAGDIDGAATILSNARFGGSAGFLLRLVLVSSGGGDAHGVAAGSESTGNDQRRVDTVRR